MSTVKWIVIDYYSPFGRLTYFLMKSMRFSVWRGPSKSNSNFPFLKNFTANIKGAAVQHSGNDIRAHSIFRSDTHMLENREFRNVLQVRARLSRRWPQENHQPTSKTHTWTSYMYKKYVDAQLHVRVYLLYIFRLENRWKRRFSTYVIFLSQHERSFAICRLHVLAVTAPWKY